MERIKTRILTGNPTPEIVWFMRQCKKNMAESHMPRMINIRTQGKCSLHAA